MEVHIGIEEVLAKGVDRSGEALRDVLVTEVFANDGVVVLFISPAVCHGIL